MPHLIPHEFVTRTTGTTGRHCAACPVLPIVTGFQDRGLGRFDTGIAIGSAHTTSETF
jgi:hypothetical protein